MNRNPRDSAATRDTVNTTTKSTIRSETTHKVSVSPGIWLIVAAIIAASAWFLLSGCSRTPAPPSHTHWPGLHPAVPPAALMDAANPGDAMRRRGPGFYTGPLHELESARDGTLALDLNGDGVIDGTDLGRLLLAWGSPYTGEDLGRLLLAWGVQPNGVIVRHDTGDGRWWYVTAEAGELAVSADTLTVTVNPHTRTHRMWQPSTGWVDYEFAAWTGRLGPEQ